MNIWIVLLLLTLLLFGLGFAMHLLWIAAGVVLIVSVFGLGRRTRSRGGSRYGRARR
ncbi:hydrophobic protein [Streptomyces hiroshimensis]|uniref:Hydrophobic protein n=1 Tax=Streptomyces hiroshimensis TaxID=66424 RepID=A0ABQ2YMT1_9ACTN|nr:hydrophobic protein [Streptomyces hiroshimensis]GGX87019.1 hypothetical protein GCM10010324_35650 [Streptomyces hiroshimensis]